MLQGYWELGYDKVIAEYKLVDRNETTYTKEQYVKIKREIENLENLRFTNKEIDFLFQTGVFKKEFCEHLKSFSLPVKEVMEMKFNKGKIVVRFKGELSKVSMFEIPVMAIISEVTCADQEGASLIRGGLELDDKISKVMPKGSNWPDHTFKLVDFGTRRRYSRFWQEEVVFFLKNNPIFVGTSNVLLSMKINKKPVGTMAHEWFQVHQGFYNIEDSQVKALENWDKVYPNGVLGVALTDIFDMDTFSKDFKKEDIFSKVFPSLRHDSGDPMEWAKKAMELFLQTSNTLDDKTLVFSDGLTLDSALEIQNKLKDSLGNLLINVVFGIGTKLTNNVGVKAPNIVIKNVMTNDKPTAKISDEPGKSICEDQEYIESVKDKMAHW
jgi:nicotinate phosphoribosyltransferase